MSTLKVDSLEGSTGSTITVSSGQTLQIDGTLSTTYTTLTATSVIENDAIAITDNVISTKRSNDNLIIQPSGTGNILLDAITIADNTISTNASNANLELLTSGSGKVSLTGLLFPSSDGSNGQVLQTDGSGNLSFTTISSTSISQLNTNVTVADTGSDGTVTVACDGNTEMTITDDGVRVHGNLTVDGTRTIINTTTLSVEDNVIEVNRNVSANAGMPTYSGLKVNRGEASTATEQDLFWAWDESFADDGTTTYGNAGGAWTAFKSANDSMSASTLVDLRANIVHAVSTGAQYSDVAERFATDMPLQEGTVVMIGGKEEVTEATGELTNKVFGVVSIKPAFMMNASAGNNDSHPFIAMVGRVPVRVTGTANKGDRLVLSSTNGVARALAENETVNDIQVIGIVLQQKIDLTEHTIECVAQCRV
ncbi:hypothetical protein [uncultured Mediterranean phage]|nr:hypothetical protein [uncultured Mediterranean phage]